MKGYHQKLPPLHVTALQQALSDFDEGKRPVVALRYERTHKRGSRKPGRDYVALPGVAEDVHLGTIESVDKDRFRIRDLTRSDGRGPGLSWIRIEGVFEFALIYSKEPKPRRPAPPPTTSTRVRTRG